MLHYLLSGNAMNKVLFALLVLIFVSNSNLISKEYKFLPKWKVGDEKKITRHVVSVSNDGIEETTDNESTEFEVKVVGEDSENYILEVRTDLMQMYSVYEIMEIENEEDYEIDNMVLTYHVSKTTGEMELYNWEEAKRNIEKIFESLKTLFNAVAESNEEESNEEFESEEALEEDESEYDENYEEDDVDASLILDLIFAPIMEMFKSKESIESAFDDYVLYLYLPYNKEFREGEKLTITESAINPFKKTDSISQISVFELIKVDEKQNLAMIKIDTELDMQEFKTMMIEMMKQFMEMGDADDEKIEKQRKEIEEIDFKLTMSDDLHFDYKNSWTKKFVRKAVVDVKAPGKTSITEVTVEVTIE
jgi:hypothetical protein